MTEEEARQEWAKRIRDELCFMHEHDVRHCKDCFEINYGTEFEPDKDKH